MSSQNQYKGKTERDFNYIKYYEKAKKYSGGEQLEEILKLKTIHEAIRDYNMVSLRQVFEFHASVFSIQTLRDAKYQLENLFEANKSLDSD